MQLHYKTAENYSYHFSFSVTYPAAYQTPYPMYLSSILFFFFLLCLPSFLFSCLPRVYETEWPRWLQTIKNMKVIMAYF